MPEHFQWELQDKLFKYKIVWENYIDKYFRGNKNLWKGRGEPYIFYKHIFRKFVYQHIKVKQDVVRLENHIIGSKVDRTTIYNSLDKDPNYFKLTSEQITEILKFLNKQLNVNQQTDVKLLINEKRDRGYTTSDIARHCLVHEDAVHNILSNVKVPYHIITQIKQELS